MNITLGSEYVTAKSNVKGIVREVVKNPSGTQRVRLELSNGDTRWTTVR